MNLDEAIKHCNDVINSCDNKGCKLDHKQLKNWLLELKNLRKLKENYEKN